MSTDREKLAARIDDIQAEMRALGQSLQKRVNASTAIGQKEYETEFQQISNLLVLSMWLIEKDAFGSAPRAVRILLARIIEALGGFQVLLHSGFSATGAMAARSLFEAAANLRLILARKNHVKRRARLFEEYIDVARYKKLKKSHAISAKDKRKNAARYQAIQANYHQRANTWYWKIVKEPKNPTGADSNLRELCKFTRTLRRYKDLYPHLSDASHPGPAFEHWIRDDSGRMIVGPNFSSRIRVLTGVTVPLTAEALVAALSLVKHPDREAVGFLLVSIIKHGKESTATAGPKP